MKAAANTLDWQFRKQLVFSTCSAVMAYTGKKLGPFVTFVQDLNYVDSLSTLPDIMFLFIFKLLLIFVTFLSELEFNLKYWNVLGQYLKHCLIKIILKVDVK